MAASVLVSRELKSLQQELSAGLPEGPRGTARCNCGGPAETPDERELRDQFASELTHLFTDAEKGISTHPTQSPDASSACRRAISRSMAQPFIRVCWRGWSMAIPHRGQHCAGTQTNGEAMEICRSQEPRGN